MTKLTLTNYVQGNATLIENDFIDHYMADANGEYVKVYLYLLRCKGDPSKELSIPAIADGLECTEKDVVRALNYWKKKGLLDYETGTREIGGDTVKREPVRHPVQEAMKEALDDESRRDFQEIKHVAEMYLGKTLTKTEADAIIYFYDDLKMSADLIEYLFEYCVENGHKSIRYIKKVAISWTDEGITLVDQAKAASGKYNKNNYEVLNAFGIRGRAPVPSEMEYIHRWHEEYGFTTELIVEACNRTMQTIHTPSFEYTESILTRWKDKGVLSLEDVKALDVIHMKDKGTKKSSQTRAKAGGARNKFHNFEGRKYQDMDELARKLIETQ